MADVSLYKYISEEKFNITGETNSLNRNMQIIEDTLNNKADKTEVADALNNKADKTYVDNAIEEALKDIELPDDSDTEEVEEETLLASNDEMKEGFYNYNPGTGKLNPVASTDLHKQSTYSPIIELTGYKYFEIRTNKKSTGYTHHSGVKCLYYFGSDEKVIDDISSMSVEFDTKIEVPEGAVYVAFFVSDKSLSGQEGVNGPCEVYGYKVVSSTPSNKIDKAYVDNEVQKAKEYADELVNGIELEESYQHLLLNNDQLEDGHYSFNPASQILSPVNNNIYRRTPKIDLNGYKYFLIQTDGTSTEYEYDGDLNCMFFFDLDGKIITDRSSKRVEFKTKVEVPEGVRYISFFASNTSLGATCNVYGCTPKVYEYHDKEIIHKYDGYFDNIPSVLDFTVGEQSIIYLDGLIADKDYLNKWVDVKPSSENAKKYILCAPDSIYVNPPTEGDKAVTDDVVGTLDFLVRDKDPNIITQKQVTARLNCKKGNKENKEPKRIMIVGDSLIGSGEAASLVFDKLCNDNDYDIIQVGSICSPNSRDEKVNCTKGTCENCEHLNDFECALGKSIVKHEGRGSWSWTDYVNPDYESTPYMGRTNPFMYDGALNFIEYAKKYNNEKAIDIAIISLGTNDMGHDGWETAAQRKENAEKAIESATIFIDALIRDFPDCKIALGLPSFGAASRRFASIDGAIETSSTYAKYMIEKFDNGKYYKNDRHYDITCVCHGAYIDRINGYPLVTGEPIKDEFTGRESYVYTNTVHPKKEGYFQFGVGYYNKIRAFLNGSL